MTKIKQRWLWVRETLCYCAEVERGGSLESCKLLAYRSLNKQNTLKTLQYPPDLLQYLLNWCNAFFRVGFFSSSTSYYIFSTMFVCGVCLQNAHLHMFLCFFWPVAVQLLLNPRTNVSQINATWPPHVCVDCLSSLCVCCPRTYCMYTLCACICFETSKNPDLCNSLWGPGVTLCQCGQRSRRWWHNPSTHPSNSINGCHPILGQHPPTFGHLASLAHTPGCLCPSRASLRSYE